MRPLKNAGFIRFSQLSPPRQALVRLCQSLNFGQIRGLHVQNANPSFDPAPTVLVDVKLDSDEAPRQELELKDFELRDEVRRLMAHLDELQDGRIDRIEVRSGISYRVIIERHISEASR